MAYSQNSRESREGSLSCHHFTPLTGKWLLMATECHPPSSVNLWACTVSIFLCNRLHWLFSCSKSQVKFGKEATVPSLTYTGTKSQDSPDQGSRQSQGTQFNDKCTVTGASMALAVQRCLPEDSDGMLATWLLLKRLHHLLCADCRGRSGRGMLPGLSTTQLAVLQTLQRLWV